MPRVLGGRITGHSGMRTQPNIRYGHIEVRVGGKGYHWKTSTQSEFLKERREARWAGYL